MRDWLAHRLLTVLAERRRRETIPKSGCKRVRKDVKRGDFEAAVKYLVETAAEADDPVADWLDTPLRAEVARWEAAGQLDPALGERIRSLLDAGEWTAAVELVARADR